MGQLRADHHPHNRVDHRHLKVWAATDGTMAHLPVIIVVVVVLVARPVDRFEMIADLVDLHHRDQRRLLETDAKLRLVSTMNAPLITDHHRLMIVSPARVVTLVDSMVDRLVALGEMSLAAILEAVAEHANVNVTPEIRETIEIVAIKMNVTKNEIVGTEIETVNHRHQQGVKILRQDLRSDRFRP